MCEGIMTGITIDVTPDLTADATLVCVGGEGREKRLADIDRCEKQAAELVQQATAVPLGMVSSCPCLHTLLQ